MRADGFRSLTLLEFAHKMGERHATSYQVEATVPAFHEISLHSHTHLQFIPRGRQVANDARKSVFSPRMRCQRVAVSMSECSSMWPMCMEPVTLVGGTANRLQAFAPRTLTHAADW